MTYQKAADGGVDLPEDVADHVESCNKAELQSVVDHHVDEHDVPRILIEETRVRDKQETKCSRAATNNLYELSIYLLIMSSNVWFCQTVPKIFILLNCKCSNFSQ